MDLSLFNNQVSVYRSANDNKGKPMSVCEFMNLGKSPQYNSDIIAYRSLKQSISEEDNPLIVDSLKAQAKKIKERFPAATISGLFSPTRARINLVQHSGLMCVDIDDHYEIKVNGKKVRHEQSLDHVPEILQQLPWIAYAGHSVGGVGYFALIPLGPLVIPVDDTFTFQSHEWYFECLEQEFLELGIVIDRTCRDTTRLRFISWDSEPCVRNPDCLNYMGRGNFVSRNERIKQQQEAQRRYELERARLQYSKDPEATYRLVCQLVDRAGSINLLQTYEEWYQAAAALAYNFRERGRHLFHAMSRMDSRYNTADTDKQYDACMRRNVSGSKVITIGSLLYMFDRAGIRIYDKKS